VAAVSRAMGRPLMPHQQHIVDVFLEVQSEEAGDPEPGEWAYDDGAALLERRAGKTSLISPIVTHRARLVRRASMWMTAQTRDKARSRWMDVTDDLLATPLRNDVRRKIGNMHEELRWLEGGAKLRPFAPNEDGLHSETPDLVLVDELWAFDAEQARAIKAGYVPAFATSSGQSFKMSTAGTEKSAWLNQVRRAGRAAVEAGVRRGIFYYEHSLPDRVGGVLLKNLTDDQLVQACIDHHPAVCHVPGCPGPRQKRPCPHGFTVRPAAIVSAWSEMDDRSEFLRAYGNRSAADLAAKWQAVDEATWLRQIDPDGIPAGARVGFGVWISEDGEDSAVSAGFRDDSGQMHVEIPQTVVEKTMRPAVRSGTRWLRGFLAARVAKSEGSFVTIPNVGAARDVADELEKAGLPVIRVSQADVSAACARHRSELQTGSWWHAHSNEATKAAEAAAWVKAGGGFRWDEPGESIAALGAQTMAGWGIDHAPELAPKLGRFAIG